MMRSLYAGVSGLQNHQTRMDVLGNNIANVNTTGFKKGRVQFQDMISQSVGGASSPTEELGGVNPKQVGLGVTVATIDTIHTQGSLQSTGIRTDLAVDGEGLFILRDGDNELYTRAGNFNVDGTGVLVNPSNGMRVQGWQAEQIGASTVINTASDVEDLFIPLGSKDPASATTSVELACNLNKTTPLIPAGASPEEISAGTWAISKTIYDTFGSEHTLDIAFTRDAVPNEWTGTLLVDGEAVNVELAGLESEDGLFHIGFDNRGVLSQAFVDPADLENRLTDGDLLANITFNVPETTEGQEGAIQTFALNLGEVNSAVETVTQMAATSSTKAFRQDGYGMGYLEDFRIDQTGTISGIYSNGTNRSLGRIALATFTNPGGLEKAGETAFVASNNSGEANIGPTGIAGKGSIISGSLEMSNVDLSEQFTDLIVTQRGFQANSKTITTSDEMLQVIMSLK